MPKPRSHRVAIAFEGGEDPEPAGDMLEVLGRAGARATFFLDGLWAEACSTLVQRIGEEGHELGNHGHGHPDWTALSDAEVRADLARVEGIAQRLAGRTTKPWALPPKSAIDDRVTAVLAGEGYTAVNAYPLDSRGWSDNSANAIVARAIEQVANGFNLVVIHTGRLESVEALTRLLVGADAIEAQVVPISGLATKPHYPPDRPDLRP